MVPEAGLEPARLVSRGILNPLCLPIPPLGHRVCYLKQAEFLLGVRNPSLQWLQVGFGLDQVQQRF